jgi:hypothetical protein
MQSDPFLGDESGAATTDALLARMRRIEAGEFWPSDNDPPEATESPLTEEEAGRLRAEFYRVMKALPARQCLSGLTPPCRRPPIQSHGVQRKGPLALLDDGTGHVLVLGVATGLPSSTGMIRRGVKQATTFPGLCERHDAGFFRAIDTQKLLPPTDEQLFSLSYRAILQRLLRCRESELLYANFLKLAVKARDRGGAADFLAHLTRMRWGTKRLEAVAAFYARMRDAREWTGGLTHLVGSNIFQLPFAASAYFEPTFNPDGSRIEAGLGPYIGPFVTLCVVPQSEGSVVALSYPVEFKSRLDAFLSPFRPPVLELTFIERVWETALLYCDDVVVAPRHWAGLPHDVQQAILAFAASNPLVRHAPPGDAISLFRWA